MPAQHRIGHRTRDHAHKMADAHHHLTHHAHELAAAHYAEHPPAPDATPPVDQAAAPVPDAALPL